MGVCIEVDDVFNTPVDMYIHPTAFTDPEAYEREFHKYDIRPDGNDISKIYVVQLKIKSLSNFLQKPVNLLKIDSALLIF